VEETQCVALVLLGDRAGDIEGAYDLCASIFHYEPESARVFLICDSEGAASQAMPIRATFGSRVTVAVAPSKHPVDAKGKYLGANVLYGLNLIESRFQGSFVLKLDADSLIIAPFCERVHEFLRTNVKCGICGTLGRTNARDHETYGFERRIKSPLIRMISSLPSAEWDIISSLTESDLLQYARDDSELASHLRACATIAKPVQEALLRGYRWLEYCQGGGYAISWPLLRAMRSAGYLAHAQSLYSLPTGEDVLLSMYCRSLSFYVMDYSDIGQPFACMWRGLPYPPNVLIHRQHAIVHSLKGDKRGSREELQLAFQRLRA
jgi:hypothetical protein